MGKTCRKVLSCLCLLACLPCCFPCYIGALRSRKRRQRFMQGQDDYLDDQRGPKSPCDVRPLRMGRRRRISIPECVRRKSNSTYKQEFDVVEILDEKGVAVEPHTSGMQEVEVWMADTDEVDTGVEGQIAYTQKQSFLFSKLPPELRRLIWQECLSGYSISLGKMEDEQRLRHFKLFEDRGIMLPTLDEADQELIQASNRFLPLIQSCRRIYTEAVSVMYSHNTFNLYTPRTLLSLSTTLLPSRLNHIRHLNIKYTPPVQYGLSFGPTTDDILSWKRTAVVLASMKSLRILNIVLFDRGIFGSPVDWEGVKVLLSALKGIKQTKRFVITIDEGPWVPGAAWAWNGLPIPGWQGLANDEEEAARRREAIVTLTEDAPYVLRIGLPEEESDDERLLWLM